MSATTHECHFWKLPVEIRFYIYDLVYGRGKTICPRFIFTSVELVFTGRRAKSSIASRNPPDVSVDYECRSTILTEKQVSSVAEDRLVSKEYLSEAMQHLAENNAFQVCYFQATHYFTSAFRQHIRSLDLEWYKDDTYRKANLKEFFPKLKRLNLIVNTCGTGLFDLTKRPKEDSIRKLPIVVSFSLVRGIEEFSLAESSHPRDNARAARMTKDEKQIRVAMLESLLHQIVTRPAADKGRKA